MMESVDRCPAAAERAGREGGSLQFLTFSLAGEEYGVHILKVREIRGWAPVTQIPSAPAHVRGVLSLRGIVVPIIDLRMHLGLEPTDYTAATVVIVLSVASARGDDHIVGVVVDSVTDVAEIRLADIRPSPELGDRVNAEFVHSIASVDGRMVMLLDVDRSLGQLGGQMKPGEGPVSAASEPSRA